MGELTPAGEDTCAVCGAIGEDLIRVRPLEAARGADPAVLGDPAAWPPEWWCEVCCLMHPHEKLGPADPAG
jgi:hypothetical protein